MSVEGKTKENLIKAFKNESKARNLYEFYAACAKKEGYPIIANMFEDIAHNEKEHSEVWLKEMDCLKNTADCLTKAAMSEHREWTCTYQEMAKDAEEEGYHEIAKKFLAIANIEGEHYKMFKNLLKELSTGSLFHSEEPIKWKCTNCGNIYEGCEPPDTCPACDHERGYYTKCE